MALPPWTVEVLRRSLSEVASRTDPQQLQRWKDQASQLLTDLPGVAARGVETVMQTAKQQSETVEKWAQSHTRRSQRLINASGVLRSPLGTGIPPSAEVLSHGIARMDAAAIDGPATRHRIESAARQMGQPSGDVVFQTRLPAAVVAVCRALSADKTLCFHRSQAVRLDHGPSIPDLLREMGVPVREIGSIDGFDASDFPNDDQSIAVVLHRTEPLPDTLPAIVVLTVASVTPIDNWDSVPVISQQVRSENDVAIVACDGLIGGGAGAAVCAAGAHAKKLQNDLGLRLTAANDAAAAMMTEAILSAENPDAASAVSLLHLDVENLRGRAERMATRLGDRDRIASCRVSDDPCKLDPSLDIDVPSRQLRIRPSSVAAADMRQKALQGDPSVACTVDGNEVVVDLRWVLPSDDAALADVLAEAV